MVHPLKNILNRLQWDVRESSDNYLIIYRHRGVPGDAKQVRASRISKLGKSYFTMKVDHSEEETTIPFHRVLEIRNTLDGSIIWTSRKR